MEKSEYTSECKHIKGRKNKMKIGIVGLPNVGKSTLFNSITNAGAECANYPFCTIEPNVGVVPVPDERLDVLTQMYHPEKTTHAIIEFVDIAGLVKGASKGEGLGNKFLSHIREVDAIAHVVRCFEDSNIVHVDGSIDPLRDIETINLELIFSDMELVEKRLEAAKKKLKADKEVMLKSCQKDGQTLYFASEELRDDKEVVKAAVENKGIIIKYASFRLRNDKELAEIAVKQNKQSYYFITPERKQDEEIKKLME